MTNLQEVRSAKQEAEQIHSKQKTYVTNRRLEDPTEDSSGSYIYELGEYKGGNVYNLIEKMLNRTNKLRILDVGCGEGNFLMELKQKFGDKIDANGINTFEYHNDQKLRKSNINVEISDIDNFNSEEEFDLIVGVHSLQYTSNPMSSLKKIYRILKPGGIAMIQPFPVNIADQIQRRKFISYLEDELDFTISTSPYNHEYLIPPTNIWYGISFQKTKSHLYLPLTIDQFKPNLSGDNAPQAYYRYVGK